MGTIGARLRQIRTDNGFTLEQFASAAGVSRQAISQIEKGVTKNPEAATLEPICRKFGVNLHWLMTGKGAAGQESDNGHSMVPADETPPGYVRFPLLEGFVAAGEGGYVPDYPEVVREIDVAEEWARRNLSAPTGRIRVVTAQGDSMKPEIQSGDVLFVDSGVTWFDADAVYVMNWRGRPIVKRLQARRDGTLLIKSANPDYESESVSGEDVDQLHISGRVVGIWNFRKY